jgi:hypothetical protein
MHARSTERGQNFHFAQNQATDLKIFLRNAKTEPYGCAFFASFTEIFTNGGGWIQQKFITLYAYLG